MKIKTLTPKYLKELPKEKEEGILYISKEFGLAIHLCACGCGVETVTPFAPDLEPWTMTENNGLITLRPSIGNFKGERPYHAHYYITDNEIEWL